MSLSTRGYKFTIFLRPAVIQLNVLCDGLIKPLKLSRFQIFLRSPIPYACQSTCLSQKTIKIFSDTRARPAFPTTLPSVGSQMDLYGQPVTGHLGQETDQKAAGQSLVSHPLDTYWAPRSSHGTCGGQTGSRTSFSSSCSVFKCQYHCRRCFLPIGSSI